MKKRAGKPKRPAKQKKGTASPKDDVLERRFNSRAELDTLLAKSGALGDTEDVVGAFKQAVAKGVPPQPVIMALWQDEPEFASPEDAEQLFSNLLGLYELVASGTNFDLSAQSTVASSKRQRAPTPEPLTGAPDDAWLESAWRHLDDAPKERERLGHAFDNRQDALVSLIDASELSDAGFAFVRELCFEIFAMLELGGRHLRTVHEEDVPQTLKDDALPDAVRRWVDDALVEAEDADEHPLPEDEHPDVRDLALRLAEALWQSAT